jgi:folate-binding protein YgfZ
MIAHLPSRAVLHVTGADRAGFLNGLVSNDVTRAAPGHAIYAALLTPQGKYLADFFIHAEPDRLLLDCDAGQSALVAARLLRFKLRADIAITPAPHQVYVAWGDQPDPNFTPDPRLPEAGWRALSHVARATTATAEAYDLHRLALGLPDGARDLEPEKSVLLEAGFDELNGISWTKGCYMGQELTARTRYRGLIKRRLLPIRSELNLPATGTSILSHAREVGQIRSSNGTCGMALLRLEAISADLTLPDGQNIRVSVPAWARIPEPA